MLAWWGLGTGTRHASFESKSVEMEAGVVGPCDWLPTRQHRSTNRTFRKHKKSIESKGGVAGLWDLGPPRQLRNIMKPWRKSSKSVEMEADVTAGPLLGVGPATPASQYWKNCKKTMEFCRNRGWRIGSRHDSVEIGRKHSGK